MGTGLFVQVGASRDGRDPYLAAARRRGMAAVLVETPAYAAHRARLGREPFDVMLPVDAPADPRRVLAALRGLEGEVRLILPGFECYARSAHRAAYLLGVGPSAGAVRGFVPPDKHGQRTALCRHAPEVLQPLFQRVPPAPDQAWARRLPYPAVLKPVDGGGGLGVVSVPGADALLRAIGEVRALRNYDHAPFRSLLVEERVDAPEASVQGIARGGACELLSYCRKVIGVEPAPAEGCAGFRELAHVALPAGEAPAGVASFAESCLRAVAYRDGPFHVDFRETPAGPVFLEMGFRLSGAAVSDLVREVSGVDWGEAAFAWMLGERPAPAPPPARRRYAAAMVALSPAQVAAAHAAGGGEVEVRVEPLPAAKAAPHSRAERELLAADLSRHGGALARVRMNSGRLEALLDMVNTFDALRTHTEEEDYELHVA